MGAKSFLKKVYEEYVAQVVTPLCKENFQSRGEERQGWNLRTYRFFHDKGVEYFNGIGLDEMEYEIRCRSDFLRQIDRELWKIYQERYGKGARFWFPGEYLVDLCWRRWDRGLYRTELAMEMEWNPTRPDYDYGPRIGKDYVDEDLYKLMDIRAPFKVGILGCTLRGKVYLRSNKAEKIVNRLSQWIGRIGARRESYLIIFADWHDRGGLRGYHLTGEGKYEKLREYRYDFLENLP